MINLKGKYGKAVVYTDNLDKVTISQIIKMMNNKELAEGNSIKIMPDAHAGKGSVVGFTSTLGEYVIPNIVGVDIGCGILTVNIGSNIDLNEEKLEELDIAILEKEIVPLGYDVRKNIHPLSKKINFENLTVYKKLKNIERIKKSLGSLGSGNHFIEIAKSDKSGNHFLIIHTGSRSLGKQVATLHQEIAITHAEGGLESYKKELRKEIDMYKKSGREKEIESLIRDKRCNIQLSNELRDFAALSGSLKEDYLNDMEICQRYASISREIIADAVIKILFDKSSCLGHFAHFETVHNYIDFKDNIIRKGSISADRGETVLIPLNMRDGSILGIGKGNKDWNNSAPHGAGRIMSRSVAKKLISLESYVESMNGIHAKTVGEATIDESPFAYKPMNEIIYNIGNTVDVIDILRPIYNIKG